MSIIQSVCTCCTRRLLLVSQMLLKFYDFIGQKTNELQGKLFCNGIIRF